MKTECRRSSNWPMMRLLSDRFSLKAAMAGAFLFAMAPPAFSQSEPVVTLESPNKSISITGKLIAMDDQSFTIEGALGVITVPRIGVQCKGDGCPGAKPETTQADVSREVVLDSIDDETKVSGELIDVEEKHYVIRTSLGEFRVLISSVKCLGDACPDVDIYNPDVTIFASSPKVNVMLADLLHGYANATGQRIETGPADEANQTLQIFSADGQKLVANIVLAVKDRQDAARALYNKSADILVYEQRQIDSQLRAAGDFKEIMQSALAFDGQAVVSNPDNPVRDLSLAEINWIWEGEITSWSTLGGGDFPITIHMVQDGTDKLGWLTGLRASNTPGVVTHSTEEQVIEAVNADRNAIGVVHWTVADQANAKMLAVRKACGLTAEPSKFGIRTQHYPFTHPINVYGREAGVHPFVKSFLAWSRTEPAASHVSKWGYTSALPRRTKIQDMGVAVVHTAAVEPDFDGAEFATMMRELRTADRLSITFRFLSGSSVLDEESALEIKDLADRIRGKEFASQEVLLVGFADNTGPAQGNTSLSVRRAETVRNVLAREFDAAAREKLGLVEMGFGEQMPVDCNSTEPGRANNRRVEVWARVKK